MIVDSMKGLFQFSKDWIVAFDGKRFKKPFRIVQYYFPIAELQEEVYSRTSNVAKHTPAKDGTSQFDKATLSSDEKEIFDSLCKKAANEVAKVIMPFLPFTQRAYIYDKGYVVPRNSVSAGDYALAGNLYMARVDSHTDNIGTDDFEMLDADVSHSVHFICKKAIDVFENSVQMTDDAIREMLVAYIIMEWFADTLPERWEQYAIKYEKAREDLRFNLNMLDRPVRTGHPF